MSTYNQILYHIVFGTKNRSPVLVKPHWENLYRYIHAILKNNKCHVYRINGVEDHIHILTHLHPSASLSYLIKDMKLACHSLINKERLFPAFQGWQRGYGAFTHHINDKNRLINYIKKQEIHLQKITWKEEFKELLKEHRITFDEKYLL